MGLDESTGTIVLEEGATNELTSGMVLIEGIDTNTLDDGLEPGVGVAEGDTSELPSAV